MENASALERQLNTENRPCRVCGCTVDRACAGGCSWALAKSIGPHTRKFGPLCSQCDERSEAIKKKLSDNQRFNLVKLAELGAFSTSSPSPFFCADLSPGAMGGLNRKGCVDKRVMKKSGQQRTVYWLTLMGREVARLYLPTAKRKAA